MARSGAALHPPWRLPWSTSSSTNSRCGIQYALYTFDGVEVMALSPADPVVADARAAGDANAVILSTAFLQHAEIVAADAFLRVSSLPAPVLSWAKWHVSF